VQIEALELKCFQVYALIGQERSQELLGSGSQKMKLVPIELESGDVWLLLDIFKRLWMLL